VIGPQASEPEFCPNAGCRYHEREAAGACVWYVRFGAFHTRARGRIQRFRCRSCGKSCSTQTFSVHYWSHYTNDLRWLLGQLYACAGLRQIARLAGVTHRVIQNRCRRLARNALAVMDLALQGLELGEHVAMDGFESFTRSQYHPNNITHLCGCHSQFIYAAVHTLVRRKGAMSEKQRQLRAAIDSVWTPSGTIAEQCSEMLADLAPVLERACEHRAAAVELRSDEHPAYRRALRSVASLARRLEDGTLVHRRTPSRAARTTGNPLFAVNYVDRQLRKNLAEYVRETVRQGREVNSQMERFSIFMVLHNFLTPHRITDHARPADYLTHAKVAGLTGSDLDSLLSRMSTHRHVYTHLGSAQWWIRRIWLHLHENPPAVKVRRGCVRQRVVSLAPAALPRYLLA